MNKDKEIIQVLLQLVDSYDKNNISKQRTIACYQEGDLTIIINLSTKGDTHKNTPFYFGNMDTCIIKEYWLNNEVINAEMLYQLRS